MGDRILPQREKKRFLAPGFSQMHWLRLTQSGVDLAKSQPRTNISWEEIAQHASTNNAWTVLDGKVYNITSYLPFHPGGVEMLMMAAGKDGTALFQQYHAWVNGHAMLQKCFVGTAAEENSQTNENSSVALSRSEWRAFRLLRKERIVHGAYKLTLELPKSKTLGLQFPGEYIRLRFLRDGQYEERLLTPISRFSMQNAFELIVKARVNGVFGQFLENVSVHEFIEMRGPESSVIYGSPGVLQLGTRVIHSDIHHFMLLAAGSGITPMLQMLRAVLEDTTSQSQSQSIRLSLIYCNRSVRDILALDQIEPLNNIFPDRIRVVHVLSYTNQDFDEAEETQCKRRLHRFVRGRLDKSILKQFLPSDTSHFAVIRCGPFAFQRDTATLLKELGIDSAFIHEF